MLADPEHKIPKRFELATRYGVDERTISRDMASPELAELTKTAINQHIGATGIAVSYKLILQAVAGQLPGVKVSERLAQANWLCENSGMFRGEQDESKKEGALAMLAALHASDPEKEQLKKKVAELEEWKRQIEERVTALNGKGAGILQGMDNTN
jgi:predicted DNA-binding transcriptional regulator YafY